MISRMASLSLSPKALRTLKNSHDHGRQKTTARLKGLIGCILILTGAATATARAQQAGDVFVAGHVQTLPGQPPLAGERGYLFVPENRSDENSRLIAVSFLRFSSTSENPGPPVFWLSGGPGDSALRRFVNGSFDPRFIEQEKALLEDMRAAGDVIIADQRGAGLSAPFLMCAKAPAPLPLGRVSKRSDFFDIEKAAAARCKEEWSALGHDADGYHIAELADDVKALKDALGYDQIILFGGSFGSQWSLSIMRRHPDIVARALLRGIEDTNDTFDSPDGLLSAIRAILADAEADPDIVPLVPEGGFVAAIENRIKELEDAPRMIDINDPATGDALKIAFGAEELRTTWWRDPDGWRLGERLSERRWPGSLAKIIDGDYRDLAGMIYAFKTARGVSMRWPDAMSQAVDCSLAGPEEIYDAYARAPATALIGDPNIQLAGACAGWQAQQLPKSFFDPLQSETPVLFIHGTFDMATPFGNAVDALNELENGRLIIVERSGHNPLTDLYKEQPGTIRPIVRRFLKTGSHEGAPETIALPPLDYKGPEAEQ